MNFTNTKTLGYKIAEVIYQKGPMPAAQIADLLPGAEPKIVQRQIGRMCFEADLESVSGAVQLRGHVQRYFASRDSAPAQIAAPRTFVVLRPLSTKHVPSSLGTRDGSNDHLLWKSKHV